MSRLKELVTSKRKMKLPLQSIALEGAKRVNKLTDAEIKKRMKRIDDDFRRAFKLLKRHPDTVTFFGSSRIPESSKYYGMARDLAHRIVTDLHLTIVSGGGPGIMEAANRGAREAQGDSIGMDIELPHEQIKNGYTTHSADFYYFFSRKVALTFTARAYVFFPGGFGTLDEFFEIMTLKQTGKIPSIPIVMMGKDFWNPLNKYIEKVVYEDTKAISKSDMSLYTITDDPEEILALIGGKPREK